MDGMTEKQEEATRIIEAIGTATLNECYEPDIKSFCDLYKKKCMGVFCSVTPNPEKCEHLPQTGL